MSEQSRQSSTERITWLVLLVLTALFSYKLGVRSTVGDGRLINKQASTIGSQSLDSSSLLDRSSSIDSNSEHLDTSKLSSKDLEDFCLAQLDSVKNTLRPHLICPPCDCKPKPKPKPKRKARKPPSVKARSPVDRQKLLAWVKRYSPRLKRCRDAGQAIYKLHAQVKLNTKKDKILSTKVKGRDVPLSARRCVENDLKRWPAPIQLSPKHPALLIFGLQLD